MIIKRVSFGEEAQKSINPQGEKRSATPRVIIKMKKTLKVQLYQQSSEENAQEEYSNSFNDTDYFNHHHQSLQCQKQLEETICHPTHIQQVRNKPKQNSSGCKLHQAPPAARQDPIRNLFLQFLKKQPVQAAKSNTLQYPSMNYSERERKYSCGSNRKDIPELTVPVFLRSHNSHNQTDTVRQLPNWDIKLTKANNSCCLVNPYTKKQYFHQRVTQSSNHHRLKKIKSLDYSIIKPNQIKAVPLSNRNEEKNSLPKKRNQRKQFPQLVAALKRKEQLWTERTREHRDQMRVLMHTSYVNRRKAAIADEPNELLPWEVEGQSNLADII